MSTGTTSSDNELQQFQELINLMKKTKGWGKDPKYTTLIEGLGKDASKEAQDVRDIMWRMIGAELRYKKLKKTAKT